MQLTSDLWELVRDKARAHGAGTMVRKKEQEPRLCRHSRTSFCCHLFLCLFGHPGSSMPERKGPVGLLDQICLQPHVGHTYTKRLFVIYLKFEFNWCPIFLFATLATLCWGPASQATAGCSSGHNSKWELRRQEATAGNLGQNQQRGPFISLDSGFKSNSII